MLLLLLFLAYRATYQVSASSCLVVIVVVWRPGSYICSFCCNDLQCSHVVLFVAKWIDPHCIALLWCKHVIMQQARFQSLRPLSLCTFQLELCFDIWGGQRQLDWFPVSNWNYSNRVKTHRDVLIENSVMLLLSLCSPLCFTLVVLDWFEATVQPNLLLFLKRDVCWCCQLNLLNLIRMQCVQ